MLNFAAAVDADAVMHNRLEERLQDRDDCASERATTDINVFVARTTGALHVPLLVEDAAAIEQIARVLESKSEPRRHLPAGDQKRTTRRGCRS